MNLIGEILPSVLRNLQDPAFRNQAGIAEVWEAVVGPKISAQTRPKLRPDGLLCVWVEQSALAFELNQKYRRAILKRAQAIWGEEKIKEVRFKTGQIR